MKHDRDWRPLLGLAEPEFSETANRASTRARVKLRGAGPNLVAEQRR